MVIKTYGCYKINNYNSRVMLYSTPKFKGMRPFFMKGWCGYIKNKCIYGRYNI